MRPSRRTLLTCLALYLLAQVLFLISIQYPAGFSFDEFHYVPSAKQMLEGVDNKNWEHPPLGKELMAIGIWLFGDRPIGWRFMSTVFGSFTWVGMYLWGLALFRAQSAALLVAALTFANHLLYVQARIGMLDTFMMAFLAFALAAFTACWDPRLAKRHLLLLLGACGAMIGLAMACKWSAVVALGLFGGLIAWVRLFQSWGVVFSPSRARPDQSGEREGEDWYSPVLWKDLSLRHWVLCLGIIPLAAYYFTFLPYLAVDRVPAYSLWDIFVPMQLKMWDGQLRVVTAHPYMSQWPGWPVMARPIWYAFDRDGDGFVRGVILLGNPLVMWGGLLALAACAWAWVMRRSREAFLILATWSALFFCWAVIPRKVSFYYYYYPAGMTLSLALAFVLHRSPELLADLLARPIPLKRRRALRTWCGPVFAVVALAVFVYFLPILSAQRLAGDEFRKWMWFGRWI